MREPSPKLPQTFERQGKEEPSSAVSSARPATVQLSKAPCPMCSTECGMAKFAKELQSAKALFPMWVTESGMVKFVKELQLVKAKSTMWVTELGMVKLAKGLQPQKAPPNVRH